MAFSDRAVVYFLHDNLDEVFDERGSSFESLRKVQWASEGDEPDPEKAKLELRRWMVTADGEKANKGMVFLTDEGPHNLAKVLIDKGFGNTKEILKCLSRRPDFKEAVTTIGKDVEEESDPNGEYFDMRDILLDYEPDEEVI